MNSFQANTVQCVIVAVQILVVLGCVEGAVLCQEPESNSEAKRPTLEQAIVIELLEDDLLESQHLLRELTITRIQKNRIADALIHLDQRLVQVEYEYQKLKVNIKQGLINERDVEMQKQTIGVKRLRLPFELLEMIEEELLPNQLERLRQIAIQRYMQESYGFQSFQFPYLISESTKSEYFSGLPEWQLEPGEKESLKALDVKQRRNYIEQRKKLLEDARNELKEKLPKKLVVAMQTELGDIVGRLDRQEMLGNLKSKSNEKDDN